MNRIKFLLLTIVSSTIFFSCKKDDDSSVITPPRDRATQYSTDITSIEDYLKTHYLTVVNDANGNPVPTVTKILSGGTETSVWDQTEYPLAYETFRNDTRIYTQDNAVLGSVIDDPVEYKVYYLKIREGVGESPTRVDSTFTSYRGTLLDGTQFDVRPNPTWFAQELVVAGWRNILTKFKTGSSTEDPSNPGNVVYSDHGVVMAFIPSGLGYFNSPPSGSVIPAYAPLVFVINLHGLKYRDTDNDGILSKDEDINGNGNLYDDDTDGDGVPNFLDLDDDGDGVLTIVEISDSFGNKYPFDLIPNCQGTTGGLKKHLDPNCQ